MIDLGRLGAAFLRIDDQTPVARDTPSVPLGTPLQARVQSAAGQGLWMVEIAGRELVASTAMSLVAGDVLDVVASRSDAGLELKVLQGAVRFDEGRYAAATLAQAGARPPAATAFPGADALAELVRALTNSTAATAPIASPAAARSQAPPASPATVAPDLGVTALPLPAPLAREVVRVVSALSELATPLKAVMDPTATAAQVRRLVEDTGLLFDSRVREALTGPTEGSAADRGGPHLPETVQRDARVLLGAMARALRPSVGNPATGTGDSAQPGASGLSPAMANAHRGLAEATLSRQLDLAAEWLQTGRLTLGVPLQFEGDRQVVAELRVGPDDDGGQAGSRPSNGGFAFDVRVELPDVGHLDATVRWVGRDISARVFVDRPELEDVTREELLSLSQSLRKAGFEHVSTEVRVDPLRHARTSNPPPPVLGGSIINARA